MSTMNGKPLRMRVDTHPIAIGYGQNQRILAALRAWEKRRGLSRDYAHGTRTMAKSAAARGEAR